MEFGKYVNAVRPTRPNGATHLLFRIVNSHLFIHNWRRKCQSISVIPRPRGIPMEGWQQQSVRAHTLRGSSHTRIV